MNKAFKFGFTLAEVLITLSIIGVIAAMTLPALVNRTNYAENVVALKKVYETLSQATYSLKSDYGSDMTGILSTVADYDSEAMANIFIPKLRINKNCGLASAKATGCFPNSTYKFLNDNNDMNYSSTSSYSTILTNDNVSYAFAMTEADCSLDQRASVLSQNPLKNICGRIYVDINGPYKGPAKWGRDMFQFWVTKSGIYPRGSYPDNHGMMNCSSTSDYGAGCAGRVILESAMNY